MAASRWTWLVPCQSRHMTVRVVLQVAVVGVDDRRDEGAGGLSGMQIAGAHDQVGQVDAACVVLQHAVGQHHQPVARPQVQRLDPVL